jgi:MarR family transcriptional repressor of emrRAB
MSDTTANLLGALALALADRIKQAADAPVGRGSETPAAISEIGHAPGLPIDLLARSLKLSHAGAVRLVDRLEADGLVERRAAEDGRAVALFLTRAGKQRRKVILARRRATLGAILEPLNCDEQMELTRLLRKLLVHLPTGEADAHSICRLCDEGACDDCPIEEGLLGLANPELSGAR